MIMNNLKEKGSRRREEMKLKHRTMSKFHSIFKFLFYLLTISLTQLILKTEQLKFTSVQIPALVQRSSNFWISCQYELNVAENDDQLYSVKWYKNNEEFYRLLFTTPLNATHHETNHNHNIQDNQQQQQKYFAQAGVNVMMSLSNATHVRLLNASLESEGSYACEISTQNLSTIRYEREIKVYVLPHSKLNIVGLKSRYSVGDKVDLICSTDYSRPQPALGWFINGQLIDSSLSQWFELNQLSRSKTNEPSLFKLTLGLKFRLSTELLGVVMASFMHQNQNPELAAVGYNQHNQSLHTGKRTNAQRKLHEREARSGGSFVLVDSNNKQHHQLSPYQLQHSEPTSNNNNNKFELKLQCKYKLTEVSDVSFNELLVRLATSGSQPTSAPADEEDELGRRVDRSTEQRAASLRRKSAVASVRQSGSEKRWIGSGTRSTSSRMEEREKLEERVAPLSSADESSSLEDSEIEVGKTLDNRLIQSRCPAQAGSSLWLGLLKTGCKHQNLVPEDPLILKVDNSRNANPDQSNHHQTFSTTNELLHLHSPTSLLSNGDDQLSEGKEMEEERELGSKRRRRAIESTFSISPPPSSTMLTSSKAMEASIGEKISVNCSTIGSFVREYRNNNWQPSPYSELVDTATPPTAGGSTTGSSSSSSMPISQPQQCFTEEHSLARRKLVISGKHQQHQSGSSNELDQAVVNQRHQFHLQQQQQQQQQRSRTSATTTTTNSRQVAYLSLSGQKGIVANQQQTTTADKLWYEPQAADSSDSSIQQQQHNILTPPLLEWFINNQEALRSNSEYSPELPMLMPANDYNTNKRTGTSLSNTSQSALRTIGGATFKDEPSSDVLPSIDYQSYFGNFNSRTIHQHLILNLTLDKKHFMTPDSKLRLRCSSTQAQVLLTDSASVAIIATFNGEHHHVWQQKPYPKSHSPKSAMPGSSFFKSSNQAITMKVDTRLLLLLTSLLVVTSLSFTQHYTVALD